MSALHAGYFSFAPSPSSATNRSRTSSESSKEEPKASTLGAFVRQTKDLNSWLGVAEGVPPLKPPKRTSPLKRTKKILKTIYRRFGLANLTPFVIITLYSCFGAMIFMAIERPFDIADRANKSAHINATRVHVAKKVEELFIDQAFANVSKRKEKIVEVLAWYENEIGFSFRLETMWTFLNAMYYCGTLYTTIGYGNVWPQTTGGRVFTIIYAIIGIPTVLSSLTSLGRLLFVSIHRACAMFEEHISRRWRRFRRQNMAISSRRTRLISTPSELSTAVPIVEELNPVKLEEGMLQTITDTAEKEGVDVNEVKVDEVRVVHVPVSVALAVTLGWMFLCAGIFCIWESNWSYFTSVYFIFISLSTIGLGDVTPDYPEYMIAVFYLVIIGLSLVSMLINVIQHRLKEVFMQVLVRVVTEYQRKIQSGEDTVNATKDMMEFWNNDKAAKFLMPLLSNSAKQTVVQQFQEEAKAHGIDVPAVLQDVDPDLGLPAILKVAMDQAPLAEQEPKRLKQDIVRKIEEAAAHQHQREARLHAEAAIQTFPDPVESIDVICALLNNELHTVEARNLELPQMSSLRTLQQRINKAFAANARDAATSPTYDTDPLEAAEILCSHFETYIGEASTSSFAAVADRAKFTQLKQKLHRLVAPSQETAEAEAQTFQEPLLAVECLCNILQGSIKSASKTDTILLGRSSALQSLKQQVQQLLITGEATTDVGIQTNDDSPQQALESYCSVLENTLTFAVEEGSAGTERYQCSRSAMKRLRTAMHRFDIMSAQVSNACIQTYENEPAQAVETLCNLLKSTMRDAANSSNVPLATETVSAWRSRIIDSLPSQQTVDESTQCFEEPAQAVETLCRLLETSLTEAASADTISTGQNQVLKVLKRRNLEEPALRRHAEVQTHDNEDPVQAVETFCQLLETTLQRATEVDASFCRSEILRNLNRRIQRLNSASVNTSDAGTQSATSDDPLQAIEVCCDILRALTATPAECFRLNDGVMVSSAQVRQLRDQLKQQLDRICSTITADTGTQSCSDDPVQAVETFCDLLESSLCQATSAAHSSTDALQAQLLRRVRAKVCQLNRLAQTTVDVGTQPMDDDPQQAIEAYCNLLQTALYTAADQNAALPMQMLRNLRVNIAARCSALMYSKEIQAETRPESKDAEVQSFENPLQAIETFCSLLQSTLTETTEADTVKVCQSEMLRSLKQKINSMQLLATTGTQSVGVQTSCDDPKAAVESFCQQLDCLLSQADTAVVLQQASEAHAIRCLKQKLNTVGHLSVTVECQAQPSLNNISMQTCEDPKAAVETLCSQLECSLTESATSLESLDHCEEYAMLKSFSRKLEDMVMLRRDVATETICFETRNSSSQTSRDPVETLAAVVDMLDACQVHVATTSGPETAPQRDEAQMLLKKLKQKVAQQLEVKHTYVQTQTSFFQNCDKATDTLSLAITQHAETDTEDRTSYRSFGQQTTKTIPVDADCQTLSCKKQHNQTQTVAVTMKDRANQGNSSMFSMEERVTQTPVIETRCQRCETERQEIKDIGVMTINAATVVGWSQTPAISSCAGKTQTDAPQLQNASCLTENLEFSLKLTQTYHEDQAEFLADEELQTDFVDLVSIGLQYSRDNSLSPEVGSLESRKPSITSGSSQGSVHSLNWDPVHGLHAEKQKPVSRLKRLYEAALQKGGNDEGPAASPLPKPRMQRFYSLVPRTSLQKD